MSLKELRSHFSPDIAARIIGVTPDILDGETYERHAEILFFLEERKMVNMPWVAIDDDRSYFPVGSPVLFVDPQKGFDSDCASRLVQLLLN